MKRIGVENFTMKELTNPKPKRVIRVMSALVNFSRHALSQDELYEQVKLEVV